MNAVRKDGTAEGLESLQNGNHLVLDSGQVLLIAADLRGFSGQRILQEDSLFRLRLRDDAGNRGCGQQGKQLAQQRGFAAAAAAGEEKVAFTAQMKKSDDRSCGWLRRIDPDRLHTWPAAPFLPE